MCLRGKIDEDAIWQMTEKSFGLSTIPGPLNVQRTAEYAGYSTGDKRCRYVYETRNRTQPMIGNHTLQTWYVRVVLKMMSVVLGR
jgi:hypothetical protein